MRMIHIASVVVAALALFSFSFALPFITDCLPLSPPRGSPELDILPLFLDLRILGDRVGNVNSVLEALGVNYSPKVDGHNLML